ncbi:CapA family protein [Hominifimenecus sp. rT4P-3]|uniref:CapA family protein n=1 Tax=Hominifimenecus sp. rT4P-3 TaxID=3242979 RepID=UPI003DA6353C
MKKCSEDFAKRNSWIFAGMAAVILTAAFLFLRKEGILLPSWACWQNRQIQTGEEGPGTIILENRRVTVSKQGEILWQSPDECRVQDVLWCDIDRDQEMEMILLCWRVGTYGKARPFWVEEKDNEKEWSQHIDIYDWRANENRMAPIWMASDIGVDAVKWAYDDTRRYLLIQERDGDVSGWAWLQWGLESIETSVSFAAVGDNLLHEAIYREGLARGSFDFLYEHVKQEIQAADVAVINQETPLVDEPGMYGGYPSFGTPSEVADAIAAAGFDVLTCATNHALDRGILGVDMTVSACESRRIMCLGIQSSKQTEYEPYQLLERRGIRFALLNYTDILNGQAMPKENAYAVHTLQEETVRCDLKRARTDADVVMVFVHWGTEYEAEPDEQQQKWMNLFLEQGVDVVIGTHPHVIQPWELLKGEDGREMLVYYSLGNFVSAQDRSETMLGGIARFTATLTLDGVKITDYGMESLVMHQEAGQYSVYFQKDYTEELAKRHRLALDM